MLKSHCRVVHQLRLLSTFVILSLDFQKASQTDTTLLLTDFLPVHTEIQLPFLSAFPSLIALYSGLKPAFCIHCLHSQFLIL